MTTASPKIITDRFGRPMFSCSDCGRPLTTDDFFDLALRLPDDGESQDDYYAAELLDGISHIDCSRAAQAS
jgi:hypothetical protein